MKKQKINIQTAALSTAALLGLTIATNAQNLGISATGVVPDASAGLDVNFTDKGVLIPRIALTSTTSAGPISNPANSLLVYNTTNNPAGGLTPGYYYNAGTPASPNWVRLLNSGTPSDAWLTLGNAGANSGLHFIGTTDNHSLRFRTNNVHRMVIDSTGNVGIGTTAPTAKLNVAGNFDILDPNGTPPSGIRTGASADAGRLWLEYSLSSAAPRLILTDYDDPPRISFRQAGSGSEASPQYESWIGMSQGLSNNLSIIAGNVGIGTTSPLRRLHVSGGSPQIIADGWDGVIGSRCSHGSFFHLIGNYDGWDSLAVYIAGYNASNPAGGNIYNSRAEKVHIGRPERLTVNLMNGNVGIGTTTPNEKLSVVGNICATGNINANSATCGSDIRWKKDLKPLENTLEKISQLKPVYYYWKKDEFPDKHFTDKRQIGLIAQDMQRVFPELVVEDKEGYLSIDYSRFTSVLLKAIQEQQQIIQEQQKIIQRLQEENDQTKSEVKALAEKMNILINTLSAEKKVGNK